MSEETVGLKRLGMYIREKRQKRNLSQRELAEEAGVGESTIGDLESAKKEPEIGTLSRVAKALPAPLGYLLYIGGIITEKEYREFGMPELRRYLTWYLDLESEAEAEDAAAMIEGLLRRRRERRDRTSAGDTPGGPSPAGGPGGGIA